MKSMNFDSKSLSLLCLGILFFIITVAFHLVSTYFYFYWTLDWIDPFIHFLGGVTSGLLFLWATYSTGGKISFSSTLTWTFIVGVVWEIYEYRNGLTSYSISFIFDTLSDLLMDLAGGILAYIFIKWSANGSYSDEEGNSRNLI